MSLLDKAMEAQSTDARSTYNYGSEAQELAMAWAEGKVNHTQIKRALGINSSNAMYNWLAAALRQAIRDGNLKPPERGKK